MNRYELSKVGIDVNEGLQRFNQNKKIYEKYLFSFVDDEYFGKIKDAVAAGDAEAGFQAAHALKGVTGTLSLNGLYQKLIPLVEELRAGSLEKAPELLITAEESYEETKAAIREQNK